MSEKLEKTGDMVMNALRKQMKLAIIGLSACETRGMV